MYNYNVKSDIISMAKTDKEKTLCIYMCVYIAQEISARGENAAKQSAKNPHSRKLCGYLI